MTRENDLMRSLVEMADTLVEDFDVIDLLTGLAERCVQLLGVSAAGVMLASPRGDLRLVAASSEAMRVVETFELQAHEGPCMDAFRTGERIEHENLEAGIGRWPKFATVAVEAGFHSAFALPLRLREMTIGALNLFSVEQIPMDEDDVLVARAFADLAAISVVQHRASAEFQLVNEQLSQALASRILVEQAKGVIFERAGIDMPEAFRRLRGYARSHNLLLTDVAKAAIDGTLDPQAWASSSPPSRS
jgi:transcriptional regulator with GAF, ATPase, and Fis domain